MRTFGVFFVLCLLLGSMASAQEESRLLRFPATGNDQIAFSYGGDLYTVGVTGGIARRLTTHEGFECFPRFSPDGRWIAFTGQYDGNTEIYVIPAGGGVPKRLSWTATLGRDDVSDRMGPNNIVMGWTHDSRSIIFRSRSSEFNDFKGQLYTVGLDGDLPRQLPLPRGGFCSYSGDDKKIAYNRIFREFRTWKRYRGGMADDIWIYDFLTKKTENITDNPAGDIIPMWHGDRIYFLSDRDEPLRMNLYVYDLKTKQTRRLTDFREFDIKFPSLGKNSIVFENGGFIYRFDLTGEQAEKVPITIANDLNTGRGGMRDVSKNVNNFEIAPDGKRALFGARGDIFSVPAKYGATRNLTRTPGVHDRNAKWSPDGKWISYISDATGEDEIYIRPQDGLGAPVQLTTGSDTYKFQPEWSPDSKKLLWADKKLRLRYVDIDTKAVKDVATNDAFEFFNYAWAPDSRWIAYAQPFRDAPARIRLYSLEQGQTVEVTDGWYDSNQPAFSPDGKYLFFVSDRDFNPIYSQTEWDHAYQDMSRIYLVTLAKTVESPFKPKSDEVEIKKEEPKPEGAGDKKEEKKEEKKPEEKKPVTVTVDADGIMNRIVGLPVKPANYGSLTAVGDSLYYQRRGARDEQPLLLFYDLKEQKETELGSARGYEISADQKKMILGREGGYAIIDLPKNRIEVKESLDLSDLQVELDLPAEWNQIFNECWRQMRDFFYAPNMHGVDWKAVHDKYQPLVKYAVHRADLTYIIGEMIGELSAGHSYVGGGDLPKAPRIPLGLLGAQLERDPVSKAYRIIRILKGENWTKSRRSPLTEIGVDAHEGDYILAVNGQPVKDMDNIYQALVNQAGKQVTLTLNSKPVAEGSRQMTVIPMDDELDLYYYNWVQANIEKVDKASGGKIGYIHIPDMGPDGLNEFAKHFYPQLRKKALIIDVRGNGGGNVSPMIMERLMRKPDLFDMARNTVAGPDPAAVHIGPKVALCDEFSASDGDLFSYRFKVNKLGTLIGKRTWGGVVGIRNSLPLLDGGFLNRPEFAPFGLDGKSWVIEGHGVDPDLVVDNDPAHEFEGVDDQLNKAVELLLQDLAKGEPVIPPVPAFPVKVK